MVSPEDPGVTAHRTWRYRLAQALMYVVNPLLLPPLLFGLVLVHVGAPATEIAWTVSVALVFFFAVPLAYVLWLVRSNRIVTVEIRDRAHRRGPFLVGLASYAVAFVLLSQTLPTAASLVLALLGAHIVNTALLLLVTLRWKISLHTAGIAGFASVMLFVAQVPWIGAAAPPFFQAGVLLPAFLLVPLLMWARVHTGAHTWGQVTAGTLFGLLVPYVELWGLWALRVFD